MTIDEIVEAMIANETEDGTWADTAIARQIIAALRAGQAMRDGINSHGHPDDNGPFIDVEEVLSGAKAWDVATKEDV
jgi:hypothetical protein